MTCYRTQLAALLHMPHWLVISDRQILLLTYGSLPCPVCRLSVQKDRAKLAETNLQGTFTKKVQQRLLWDNSLGLPSWSDEEWQQVANNSLPAALQHHIWPAPSRISPRSDVRPTHLRASFCCCAHMHSQYFQAAPEPCMVHDVLV